MAQHVVHFDTGAIHRAGLPTPGRQAYMIMHFGFAVLPIVAGADKFVGFLARWEDYLSPFVARGLPMSPHAFMHVVGIVEILAGFLVAVKPRFGAYVVAAWLAGIIANLVLLGAHYDIALRDFGLFLGALALGRLSAGYARGARDLD